MNYLPSVINTAYVRRTQAMQCKYSTDPIELLEQIMLDCITKGECILYKPEKAGRYGQIQVNTVSWSVHKLVYDITKGQIPSGMVVMHTCDVTKCVQPNHLVAGTPLENMQDKVVKGRQANGSKNGASKLTEAQIEVLRLLDLETGQGKGKTGLVTVLAQKWGVHRTTITRARLNQLWKHL